VTKSFDKKLQSQMVRKTLLHKKVFRKMLLKLTPELLAILLSEFSSPLCPLPSRRGRRHRCRPRPCPRHLDGMTVEAQRTTSGMKIPLLGRRQTQYFWAQYCD